MTKGERRIRIFEGKPLKNGDRRFGVDYFEPGTNKRRRDIIGSYDQARVAKAELELEFANGTFNAINRRDMTLKQLRDLWFKDRGPTKRSLDVDEVRWGYLTKFFGEDRRIEAITAADVIGYRAWQLKQLTRYGRPFRPATVNRALVLGKAAFNLARKHKLARDNPFAGVDLLPEDNERTRVCSDEEFDLIIREAPPRLLISCVIARGCGLRESEIASILWSNINLKKKLILIPKTKTDRARTVPMSPDVVEALEAWPRDPDDDRVVGITAGGITSEFYALRERLGLKGLTFHDLRATFATRWLRAGASTKIVKDLLGHATYAMLDRYSRLSGEDFINIAADINAKLSQSYSGDARFGLRFQSVTTLKKRTRKKRNGV